MKNNKGLSLIELVIAFALLALVGVAASGLLGTGSRLFQSTTKEIDLQTEAQSALNHLNNFIVDAQRGINFNTVADGKELEIINSSDIYYVKWKSADKSLYVASIEILTPMPTLTDADYTLFATNVEEFDVDLTGIVNGKNNVTVALKMAYDTRTYETKQEYALRNDIKANKTLSELASDPVEGFESYVKEVILSDDVQYCAKGKDYAFSARVKGKGFPSQQVTWAVNGSVGDGTTEPDKTEISSSGVLHIAADEVSETLDIVATSVGINKETGATVSDTATVKIVDITNVNILCTPSTVKIGRIVRVDGAPVFSNPGLVASGDIFQVEFRLPTEEDIALYPAENLKIYDGLDLYQTSSMTNCCDLILGAEMEDDPDLVFDADGKATIKIIAISPLIPERLFFKEITINKADLTGLGIEGDLTASRGAETTLSAKLEMEGITSSEIRTTWAITDDAGLGDKVSINAETGLLKVAKNIDYNRAFELEVTATAKTKDSLKEIKKTVKVVIPKVSISVTGGAATIEKGSSDRVRFTVNGLKVEAGDVICSSSPGLKNTLMYCTADECVISVGEKETRELVAIKVMLKESTTIQSAFSLYILSKTELSNVEGRKNVFAEYFTPEEVGRNGKETESDDGTDLIYKVETVNVDGEEVEQTVLTIYSTSYTYDEKEEKNSVNGWWYPRSNVEGKEYFIPVPGFAQGLPDEITVEYKLNYNGLLLTYKKGTDDKTYVEVLNADNTIDKFYLLDTTKTTLGITKVVDGSWKVAK